MHRGQSRSLEVDGRHRGATEGEGSLPLGERPQCRALRVEAEELGIVVAVDPVALLVLVLEDDGVAVLFGRLGGDLLLPTRGTSSAWPSARARICSPPATDLAPTSMPRTAGTRPAGTA